jgi:hypothetical protein
MRVPGVSIRVELGSAGEPGREYGSTEVANGSVGGPNESMDVEYGSAAFG